MRLSVEDASFYTFAHISIHNVSYVFHFCCGAETHAMFSHHTFLCYPYMLPVEHLVVHSRRLDTHVARSLVVMSVSFLVLLRACNRETSDGSAILAKCVLYMCMKRVIRAETSFSSSTNNCGRQTYLNTKGKRAIYIFKRNVSDNDLLSTCLRDLDVCTLERRLVLALRVT